MRHGRGEFGRDNALQWNRPGRMSMFADGRHWDIAVYAERSDKSGRRAFRMRDVLSGLVRAAVAVHSWSSCPGSGMKDLRYADPLERSQRRKKDIRPPEHPGSCMAS